MGQIVATNLRTVTDKSGHVHAAAAPNVCLVPGPPGSGPIPIPYPNTAPPLAPEVGAKTKELARRTVAVKKSGFVVQGNEPGTLKDAVTVHESVSWRHLLQTCGFSISGAMAIAEGKPVDRLQDQMLLNSTARRNSVP